VCALALAVTACGASARKHGGSGLEAIGAGLEGSSGLHATVFARGIVHMSAFTFDSRGRLWIASSGAASHQSDGVYVVAHAHARPVKAIGDIRGPLGLQWVGQSLFVSSLDGVTKFSGLTKAGHFAHRALILRGPVAGAENNNLVLAPNGRLVMGVSATCDHCANTPRYSGAVVSFRTDGSDLRIVARGVRAAYGLVYNGTVLYATMNQRDDLGARTPGDWLATIAEGQDWGFPACYGQGGSACRNVPRPVGTLDAHAAAGGVAIVGSTAVVAEWNAGKLVAVQLGAKNGATRILVKGIAHPLPVLRTANGAVLVGDWASGTVYRISGSFTQ
jgi:glucose/arabinose dehydrogenase